MITLLKSSIRGYGVLFFGGLLEGRGAYEILVSEENGTPRISGHFAGKVKVPHRHGTTTMILANGQRIKLQIRGNPNPSRSVSTSLTMNQLQFAATSRERPSARDHLSRRAGTENL